MYTSAKIRWPAGQILPSKSSPSGPQGPGQNAFFKAAPCVIIYSRSARLAIFPFLKIVSGHQSFVEYFFFNHRQIKCKFY